MEKNEYLLEVKGLKKYFKVGKGTLKAVDDVSFYIRPGETLGVVGESGCGKTTCGRTVLGLYDRTDGEVLYRGKDVHKLKGEERKQFTKHAQIIFQDPYASLDPRMTIGDIIGEPLDIQLKLPTKERMERVLKTMERVGLNTRYVNRYPHEFSGGQRQRIGIARAIVLGPKLMVCDEPVSALDVSVQAQVLNLLMDLQKEMGMAYIFISHDLSVIKHISDRIGVMYLGHLVEEGPADQVYEHPIHPYTKALLSAIPIPDPDVAKSRSRIKLEGELPTPINPPAGCPFKGRCPMATEECGKSRPEMRDFGGHKAACFYAEAGK